MSGVDAPRRNPSADALERELGDPFQPGTAWSFDSAVRRDDAEEYPELPGAALDAWGLARYYVPVEHGGRLSSYDELIALIRSVARRDLTVAVAHVKTFLGAIPIWVAGTETQKARLATMVLRAEQVALALTERGHGGDLLATATSATRTPDGAYLLSGEKWLINNATRSRAMTVLARTDAAGGPRGLSLFIVEKKDIQGGFEHLPKIRTHGIRGADISGIRFRNARLAADCLVGGAGRGFEVVLRCLQVTRTLVPPLSLGAADSALRIVASFALERKLYGQRLVDIPEARRVLAAAFADLIACDCVATSTARALHVVPDQMSFWSAVAKYWVPTTIERMLDELAVVLGARHYLREECSWGAFEKVWRDNRILSLFDGSTVVNLSLIAQQIEGQARRRASGAGAARADRSEPVFSLRDALPPVAYDQLLPLCRQSDDPFAALPRAAHVLAYAGGGPAGGAVSTIRQAVGKLTASLTETDAAVLSTAPALREPRARSMHLLEWARRYCLLHAAATSVHVWLSNREHLGPFFGSGEWLAIFLGRALATLSQDRGSPPMARLDATVEELIRRLHEGESFALAAERR